MTSEASYRQQYFNGQAEARLREMDPFGRPKLPHLSERPRVLVVEDEALLSLEISQVLADAGFNVVGPAREVARAIDLAARSSCQAAVLDVGLRLGTSEPIAWELRERGTPFVTLSAYSPDRLPVIFKTAPFLAKPFKPELLINELRRCIGHG